MITLENISKTYSKKSVLNNINFTIPKKSITGIIGPNGTGKSVFGLNLTAMFFSMSFQLTEKAILYVLSLWIAQCLSFKI